MVSCIDHTSCFLHSVGVTVRLVAIVISFFHWVLILLLLLQLIWLCLGNDGHGIVHTLQLVCNGCILVLCRGLLRWMHLDCHAMFFSTDSGLVCLALLVLSAVINVYCEG